jgi:hypothetical protein
MRKHHPVIEEMKRRWNDPIVYRTDVQDFTFRTLTPGHQAVLDCKGYGPERYKIGKKIAYDLEVYCDWLQARYFDNKKQ